MDYIETDRFAEVPAMRYSTQVKSISYLKANAAEMLQQLAELREPVLITRTAKPRPCCKTWPVTKKCKKPWRC